MGATQFGETRLRGQRCRSFTAPLAGASAEAEHELSLFDCLRVWGYCIDRCYLVDPPFVRRHLASIVKCVSSDIYSEDYRKRRSAFLKEPDRINVERQRAR